MLPEEVFVYKIGDRVCSKERRTLCGEVVSIVTDGKLSKDFITVRWDNGIKEMVLSEWIIPEDFEDKLDNRPKKNKTANLVKKEILKKEANIDDVFLSVLASALCSVADKDKVKNFLVNASYYDNGDTIIVENENKKIIVDKNAKVKAAYIGDNKVNVYEIFTDYDNSIIIRKVSVDGETLYRVSYGFTESLLTLEELYDFLSGFVDNPKEVVGVIDKLGKVVLKEKEIE